LAAAALRRGRSRLIGLVLGEITDEYFSRFAEACLSMIEARGYQLLMTLTSWNAEKEVPFQIDPDGVGVQENWHRPEFKPENWRSIRPGLRWEAQGITMPNPKQKSAMPMPYDGDGWYRITLKIPDSYRAKDLRLTMTRVDDTDQVWFNGALLGETGTDTPNYWEAKRSYRIPSELIHYGANNLIAVRVGDLGGEGGIIGEAKVTWDGAGALRPLYPRGDRLIFDFDPNGFRQW
jgi:hypothetical protein